MMSALSCFLILIPSVVREVMFSGVETHRHIVALLDSIHNTI